MNYAGVVAVPLASGKVFGRNPKTKPSPAPAGIMLFNTTRRQLLCHNWLQMHW